MRWTNHKIIALSVTSLITRNPVFLTSSFIGSTFPDAIENNYGKKLTFYNHRQMSHWFVPYLLLGVILALYKYLGTDLNYEMYRLIYSGIYFSFGSLSHIFLDGLTGTVPGINPKNYKKRIGKRLIKNDLQEYLIAFIFLLAVISIHKIGFIS